MQPKFNPGDRVLITVADDTFSNQHATVREWRRRNKPRRYAYTLDVDEHPMPYGAGPYMEDEMAKEESP